MKSMQTRPSNFSHARLSALLTLLTLVTLTSQQLLPNPCHSDCEPYMCHGPLASHCVACSHPNKKLEDGACNTCKLGFFNNPHNNSECTAFLKDCEVGTVQPDGTVICSKCYLETMQSGTSCNARDPNINIVWGAEQTVADTTSKKDAELTYAIYCKGVQQIKVPAQGTTPATSYHTCLNECSKSYTKEPAKWGTLNRCSLCQPGCKYCSTPQDTNCSSCLQGYRWNSQTNTCDRCFPTCLMCTGSRYNDCTRCDEGYFWEKNVFNNQGVCKRCHETCKSCYGPGAHQCAQTLNNMTIVARGTSSQASVVCSAACETCKENDPNFCIVCPSTGFYTYDPLKGTCIKSTTAFPGLTGCFTSVRQPDGTLTCDRCASGTLMEYRNSTCSPQWIDSSTQSRCLRNNQSMLTKNIFIECLECAAENKKMLSVPFEGRCVKIDQPNCDVNWAQSRTPVCRKCSVGFFTNEQGLCVSTCDTANGMGIMDQMYIRGAQYCARCPENCKTCTFDANILDFKCTSCFNPGTYILFNDQCVSNDCTDNFSGPNKQCRSTTDPSCSKDCMLLNDCESDLQITSQSPCRRTFFKVTFVEDYFLIELNPAYQFFYTYEIKPTSVYKTDPTSQAQSFFCDRLSPENSDPSSFCNFYPSTKQIKVWLSKNKTKMLLRRNTFKFRSTSDGAITITRLAINPITILSPPQFPADIRSEILISEKHQMKCNFILQSFTLVAVDNPLKLWPEFLNTIYQTSGFTYQVISVRNTSDPLTDDSVSLQQSNIWLGQQNLANSVLSIPPGTLVAGKIYKFRLSAITEYGNQVFAETEISTVSSAIQILSHYQQKSLYTFNPEKGLYFYAKYIQGSAFDPANLIFGFSDQMALTNSGVKFQELSKSGYIKFLIESPPDLESFKITVKYGSGDSGLVFDFIRIKTILAHTAVLPSVLKGGLSNQKVLIFGSQELSHPVKIFCRQFSIPVSCGDNMVHPFGASLLSIQNISDSQGEDVVLYFVSSFNQYDSVSSIKVKVSQLASVDLPDVVPTTGILDSIFYSYVMKSSSETIRSLTNLKLLHSQNQVTIKYLQAPEIETESGITLDYPTSLPSSILQSTNSVEALGYSSPISAETDLRFVQNSSQYAIKYNSWFAELRPATVSVNESTSSGQVLKSFQISFAENLGLAYDFSSDHFRQTLVFNFPGSNHVLQNSKVRLYGLGSNIDLAFHPKVFSTSMLYTILSNQLTLEGQIFTSSLSSQIAGINQPLQSWFSSVKDQITSSVTLLGKINSFSTGLYQINLFHHLCLIQSQCLQDQSLVPSLKHQVLTDYFDLYDASKNQPQWSEDCQLAHINLIDSLTNFITQLSSEDVDTVFMQLKDLTRSIREFFQLHLSDFDNDPIQFAITAQSMSLLPKDHLDQVFDALTKILEYYLIHSDQFTTQEERKSKLEEVLHLIRQIAEARAFKKIVRDQSTVHCNDLACFLQITFAKNLDPRFDLEIEQGVYLRLEDLRFSQSPLSKEYNLMVVYFKQELVDKANLVWDLSEGSFVEHRLMVSASSRFVKIPVDDGTDIRLLTRPQSCHRTVACSDTPIQIDSILDLISCTCPLPSKVVEPEVFNFNFVKRVPVASSSVSSSEVSSSSSSTEPISSSSVVTVVPNPEVAPVVKIQEQS